MSADCVKCQSRTVALCLSYLSVRYKTELDKRLKAVADTEDKSVTIIQKLHNRGAHLFVFERRFYELARTIGFITAAESTGEHYNLRLVYRISKAVD